MANMAEILKGANPIFSRFAIDNDLHPFVSKPSIEDIEDGDTIGKNRISGYDTFESFGDSAKAKKLEKLGLSIDRQKQIGEAGTQELKNFMKANPNLLFSKDIIGDSFGRKIIKNEALTEHMIDSGVAVPTDRYDEKLQKLYRDRDSKRILLFGNDANREFDIQREYSTQGQVGGRIGSQVPKGLAASIGNLAVDVGDLATNVATLGNYSLRDSISREDVHKAFGYDNREYNYQQQEALRDFSNGSYTSAVMRMLKSPEILTESIPEMIALVAGAGKFTKVGKALKESKRAIKGIKDPIEKAEAMAKLEDIEKAAPLLNRITYASAKNAGFLTVVSSHTNADIREFKKNNNGAGPSIEDVLGMFAVNTVTYGIDRVVFKDVIKGVGGFGVKEYKKTMSEALKHTPMEKIGVVGSGVLAVASSMPKEAAQEWIQTWGELINQRVGTAKYGDFQDVWNSQEAHDLATIAALAGAAGGVHMSTPTSGFQTVRDIRAIYKRDAKPTETPTSPSTRYVPNEDESKIFTDIVGTMSNISTQLDVEDSSPSELFKVYDEYAAAFTKYITDNPHTQNSEEFNNALNTLRNTRAKISSQLDGDGTHQGFIETLTSMGKNKDVPKEEILGNLPEVTRDSLMRSIALGLDLSEHSEALEELSNALELGNDKKVQNYIEDQKALKILRDGSEVYKGKAVDDVDVQIQSDITSKAQRLLESIAVGDTANTATILKEIEHFRDIQNDKLIAFKEAIDKVNNGSSSAKVNYEGKGSSFNFTVYRGKSLNAANKIKDSIANNVAASNGLLQRYGSKEQFKDPRESKKSTEGQQTPIADVEAKANETGDSETLGTTEGASTDIETQSGTNNIIDTTEKKVDIDKETEPKKKTETGTESRSKEEISVSIGNKLKKVNSERRVVFLKILEKLNNSKSSPKPSTKAYINLEDTIDSVLDFLNTINNTVASNIKNKKTSGKLIEYAKILTDGIGSMVSTSKSFSDIIDSINRTKSYMKELNKKVDPEDISNYIEGKGDVLGVNSRLENYLQSILSTIKERSIEIANKEKEITTLENSPIVKDLKDKIGALESHGATMTVLEFRLRKAEIEETMRILESIPQLDAGIMVIEDMYAGEEVIDNNTVTDLSNSLQKLIKTVFYNSSDIDNIDNIIKHSKNKITSISSKVDQLTNTFEEELKRLQTLFKGELKENIKNNIDKVKKLDGFKQMKDIVNNSLSSTALKSQTFYAKKDNKDILGTLLSEIEGSSEVDNAPSYIADLITENPDSANPTIKESVKDAITLGILEWIDTSAFDTINITEEDVQGILGIKEYVPEDIVQTIKNRGIPRKLLVNAIGKSIMTKIDTNLDNSVSMFAKQNIETALGHIGLSVLTSTPLLDEDNEVVRDNEGNSESIVVMSSIDRYLWEDMTGVLPTQDVPFAKFNPIALEIINKAREVFKDAKELYTSKYHTNPVYTTKDKEKLFNQDIKYKKRSQDKLSEKDKELLQEQKKTPHKFRIKLYNLFNSLGDSREYALGYTDQAVIDAMHIALRPSEEGKNITVTQSLYHLDNHFNDLIGAGVSETGGEYHFDVYKSADGRAMFDSNTFNPQNNKTHRALDTIGEPSKIFKSDKIEDLSKENVLKEIKIEYKLAVLQAFDEDVDKMSEETVENKFAALFTDDAEAKFTNMKDVTTIFAQKLAKEIYVAYTAEKAGISENQKDIAHIMREKLGVHTLDGLVEMGRIATILDGKEATSLDKHTTHIRLEGDAITSGWIIALMQMPVFNMDTNIFFLSKGGISVNNENYIYGERAEEGFRDSYETPADKLIALADKLDLPESVLNLVEIDRSLSKMVFMPHIVYGSTISGVVRDIQNKLTMSLYKLMQDNKIDQLNKTLDDMDVKIGAITDENRLEFKFNKDQQEAINRYVDSTYGYLVRTVYGPTFKEFTEARDVLNDSFNNMFTIYRDKFNEKISKLIEDKNSVLNITTEEFNTLKKELEEYIPSIEGPNGTITQLLSKGKMSDLVDDAVASLTNTALTVQTSFAQDIGVDRSKGNNPQKSFKTTSDLSIVGGPGLSGGVNPIHFIDGAVIDAVLAELMFQGIFDASLTKLDQLTDTLSKLNESFIQVNKDYSLTGKLMESYAAFMKNIKEDHKDINTFEETGASLLALNNKANANRETLFNQDMKVVHYNLKDVAYNYKGKNADTRYKTSEDKNYDPTPTRVLDEAGIANVASINEELMSNKDLEENTINQLDHFKYHLMYENTAEIQKQIIRKDIENFSSSDNLKALKVMYGNLLNDTALAEDIISPAVKIGSVEMLQDILYYINTLLDEGC